jgi:hypothetical protein
MVDRALMIGERNAARARARDMKVTVIPKPEHWAIPNALLREVVVGFTSWRGISSEI